MGAPDSQTTIVQVACGFARRPQHEADIEALSLVDRARSKEVLRRFRPDNLVFVTGMVPYDANESPFTLARLNHHSLIENDVPFEAISYVPGLNAFSESWNACERAYLTDNRKIVVVASDFYFEAYARMWQAAGKRNGLEVEIVALNHGSAVSGQVWDFYRGPKAQALSHVAAGSTLGHYMASGLADRMTAKRATEGFKIDGHTVIG